MGTQAKDSRDNALPLAHRVACAANAEQVAQAMVASWQAIDTALAPILGTRGVAALFQRSVFVTSGAHAWLADLRDGVDGRIELVALKSLFARQHNEQAKAAAEALLQSFHDLLTSLVGDALTERLLHSLRSDPSNPPPQGSSP